MAYLFDANVLIEAKNRYYAFAFCPGFWDWLLQQKATGTVLSVEAVGVEIARKQDDLSAWCQANGAGLFLPPDPQMAAAMATVATTVQQMQVNGQPYEQAAVSEFLSVADFRLIAHALAHGHVVVTGEVGHTQGQTPSRKRLKIPNVCDALAIQRASVFEMLRDTGASFVLSNTTAAAAAAGIVVPPAAPDPATAVAPTGAALPPNP